VLTILFSYEGVYLQVVFNAYVAPYAVCVNTFLTHSGRSDKNNGVVSSCWDALYFYGTN